MGYSMSIEALAQNQPEFTRSDSSEEKLEKMRLILAQLTESPATTAELADLIGNGKTLSARYLEEMKEAGIIEKVSNTAYWKKKEHSYSIDLTSTDIDKIPWIFFREISIIKPWFAYAIGKESMMTNIRTFQNICYGQTVKNFKINPSYWEHPKTTEYFYMLYKEQYGVEFNESIVKALRAFLSYCLKTSLQKGYQTRALGLSAQSDEGKYSHIKLTTDELSIVKNWLKNEGKEASISQGIEHDRLLAHFAFSFEGFPRPSRILTIETERIERHKNNQNETVLHWMQLETKQGKYWPKFMLDPELVEWSTQWLDRRRSLNYRYLFLNDNQYIAKSYDSQKLKKEREPFTQIYRQMFKDIGKKEDYYFDDTLYTLRHCGVHLWVRRLGFAGLVLIAKMGWDSMDTLLKHYTSIQPSDIEQAILNRPKNL